MDNALPSEFDLVIIGTGLAESVISAAASRIGKRVLHVDSNDYYGGQWASFNLKTLNELTQRNIEYEIDDTILKLGNDTFNITNFKTNWHIPEQIDNTKNENNSLQNYQLELDKSDKKNVEECDSKNDCLEYQQNLTSIKSQCTYSALLSQEILLKDSRKFNIDLVPKVHFARGEFVQLLISSNIARYAEYRSVSRLLAWVDGKLEKVPCSRADIFSNNQISIIEKRMLMKLLTSLNEDIEDFANDKTFLEFLQEKKLTHNLIHFVLYTISQSTHTTLCKEGIANTKRYLNSLGRFGKTAFLFSMYGSGETTQAFCRLSAVFGGIFALDRKKLALKLECNEIAKLYCDGQVIKSEHIVLGIEKAPNEFIKNIKVTSYISRAVFITDRSIMSSEKEHVTLFVYPPENGKNIVTILELGCITGTCPKDFFLVHLTAREVTTPQDDFKHIIQNIFHSKYVADRTKPNILWSCYFSVPETNDININKGTPSNIFLTSGPDLDLDYDLTITKAKYIFNQIYPDQDFLPRAPDPEEIIFDTGNDEQMLIKDVTDSAKDLSLS